MNLTTQCFIATSMGPTSRKAVSDFHWRFGGSHRQPFSTAALKTAAAVPELRRGFLKSGFERLGRLSDRLDRTIPVLSVALGVTVVFSVPDQVVSALAQIGHLWVR